MAEGRDAARGLNDQTRAIQDDRRQTDFQFQESLCSEGASNLFEEVLVEDQRDGGETLRGLEKLSLVTA